MQSYGLSHNFLSSNLGGGRTKEEGDGSLKGGEMEITTGQIRLSSSFLGLQQREMKNMQPRKDKCLWQFICLFVLRMAKIAQLVVSASP